MTLGADGLGAVALGAGDRAVAVAAVKALLRIETVAEDGLVAALAETALGLAERFTGQVTVARAMTATVATGGGWQRLPAVPVRAITGATAPDADGDAQALAIDSYAIDITGDGGAWVRIAAGVAAPATVAFTAGIAEDWEGLPMPIRQGAAMLAAHLFSARDADQPPPAAVSALWRPFRSVRLVGAVWP